MAWCGYGGEVQIWVGVSAAEIKGRAPCIRLTFVPPNRSGHAAIAYLH